MMLSLPLGSSVDTFAMNVFTHLCFDGCVRNSRQSGVFQRRSNKLWVGIV